MNSKQWYSNIKLTNRGFINACMVKFEHILNTSILLIYPILVRGICKIYIITMHVLFYFTFVSFSKIIFNVTIHVYSPVYGIIDLLRDNCIKYSSLLYSPAQVTSRSYGILIVTFLQSQGTYKYTSWQKGFSNTTLTRYFWVHTICTRKQSD